MTKEVSYNLFIKRKKEGIRERTVEEEDEQRRKHERSSDEELF